jgi:hypothetical protein
VIPLPFRRRAFRLRGKGFHALQRALFHPLVTISANLDDVRVFPDFFHGQLVRLKRIVTQNANHFHDSGGLSGKGWSAVPPFRP